MTNIMNLAKIQNRTSILIGAMVIGLTLMVIPFATHAATLDRELQVGMSGSDVTALQTFLAQDRTIYPQGLITGYFGFLTKAAVSNFQSRNGISAVGRVGPATLPVINAQMSGGVSNGIDMYAPMISGVNVNTGGNNATVSWSTSEPARGVVYFSTSYLIEYEHPHSVDVSGSTASTDNNLRTSQSVVLSGLQSNTIYYYLVYVTDASGNVSITLPSTFRSI